jgi:hypothetical protein
MQPLRAVLTMAFVGITSVSSAYAQQKCDTVLKCAQDAVEAASASNAAVKALQGRLDALEKTLIAFGGGRVLAIAQVKNNVLIVKSEGVSYDTGEGEIIFPNTKGLKFVPLITTSDEAPYITNIDWIASIDQKNNKFVVRKHALDTSDRTYRPQQSPYSFTAVIVGFEETSKK